MAELFAPASLVAVHGPDARYHSNAPDFEGLENIQPQQRGAGRGRHVRTFHLPRSGPDDPMIPRYNPSLGANAIPISPDGVNRRARSQLHTPNSFPLFLTINAAESREALHQMGVLRQRLNH